MFIGRVRDWLRGGAEQFDEMGIESATPAQKWWRKRIWPLIVYIVIAVVLAGLLWDLIKYLWHR